MLEECPYYIDWYDVGKDLQDSVIRKIQILHSHGVDIGSKDNRGRGCLHTLLSAFLSFGIYVTTPEASAKMIIGTLSCLIRMGADIHAVDGDGLSVTEMAHNDRFGRLWEAALERSGLSILQVYLDDHHSTSLYSDDIYAPDEDHPRQVRPLINAYYNSPQYTNNRVRDILLYGRLDGPENTQARVIDLADTESSEDEIKASEWSEGSIIEDYHEESHSSPEQYGQISGEDQPDASSEEESSDEEMGGVSVAV